MKKAFSLFVVMTVMLGGTLIAETTHNTQIINEQSNRVNEPLNAPLGEITCEVNGVQRTVKTSSECKALYGTIVELSQASISNKKVSYN